MAIVGIFFGSDTGNTENIAKMIQKQLGKEVAEVHDIAKSSKEDLEAFDILLLGILHSTTAKRSATGMISSLRWKRSISTVNWWPCLAVAIRKITQSISVMPWAPSATSSNRTARLSSVTGQPKVTTSKPQKAWQTISTSGSGD